jgi:hypothetical protein
MNYCVFMLCILQISALNINVSIKIPLDAPFVKFELNCSNYTVISADDVIYNLVTDKSSNGTNSGTVTPVGAGIPTGELVLWCLLGGCGGSLILLSLYFLLRPKQPVLVSIRDPAAIKISRGQILLSEKGRR